MKLPYGLFFTGLFLSLLIYAFGCYKIANPITLCESIGMQYQSNSRADGFNLCYAINESGYITFKPIPKIVRK